MSLSKTLLKQKKGTFLLIDLLKNYKKSQKCLMKRSQFFEERLRNTKIKGLEAMRKRKRNKRNLRSKLKRMKKSINKMLRNINWLFLKSMESKRLLRKSSKWLIMRHLENSKKFQQHKELPMITLCNTWEWSKKWSTKWFSSMRFILHKDFRRRKILIQTTQQLSL